MSEPAPLLTPIKPKQSPPRLWRDGAFVPDPWTVVGDDDTIFEHPNLLVSLTRWRRDQSQFAVASRRLGVSVEVGASIDFIADSVSRLAVVALPFPKFSDGRAYSTARRLREAGFKGEIRAVGDVLLDQLPLMLRAGFDAFEITNAATIKALEQGKFPAIQETYQTAAETTANAPRFSSRRAYANAVKAGAGGA